MSDPIDLSDVEILVDLSTGAITMVRRATEEDKAAGVNDYEVESILPGDEFAPQE